MTEPPRSSTFSSGMEKATNYNNWIVDIFSHFVGNVVMEVGIGHGSFAGYLLRKARSYVGVDIDSNLIEHARKINPGLTYITADVTSPALAKAVKGLGIDTILACNVLEHVPEDSKAVDQLLTILPPGGHLLLYAPAFAALYNQLDRLAGHYRRYTRQSLARLINPDMGEIIQLTYVNPIGGLGWWLTGRFRSDVAELDEVNGQILFFDRYILPLSRMLTPLFSKAFGQSVVCVIRRRHSPEINEKTTS